MAKGPMTVTGFIAFAQGWGGLYIRANKLAYKQLSKHPGLGIPNPSASPTSPSGSTGRTTWPATSARPAPTTTAPSGAPGSPTT